MLDLHVEEVLLQVGEAYLLGRRRQVALAVEEAVLELGLLRDARLAEELAPDDLHGREIAHLAAHDERHLDAARDLARVGADVLELAGVLERDDVARHRDGVVLAARFRLTAVQHGTDVAAEPVEGLHLHIDHVGCVRDASEQRKKD